MSCSILVADYQQKLKSEKLLGWVKYQIRLALY